MVASHAVCVCVAFHRRTFFFLNLLSLAAGLEDILHLASLIASR